MNKKILAIAVSSALAVPMAAHAVKYKLSGQVNRAIVAADNGNDSDVQFIDNGASNSRWRMKGSEDIGNGMKVGFNWEWAAKTNAGGGDIGDSAKGLSQDLRLSEIWFSGGWGKVSVGKGNGAGNGTTESDLSGTALSGSYNGRTDIGANIVWRTSRGAAITDGSTPTTFSPDGTGIPVIGGTAAGAKLDKAAGLNRDDTFSAWDAFSRYDRIRYDSPALGPVTLSVSAGAVDRYEGAVRWSQGLGGGQISAGAFYGQEAGKVDSRYGGSIAYLFSFGTNLVASYGSNEPVGKASTRSDTWYLKVGHKWGNNAVSVGYGESEDVVPGFTDTGFNIGFNHSLPKAKVDLYAGYAFSELDLPSTPAFAGVSAEDIQTFVVGGRLKFD
ncbi:MAG: hypothetical protein BMS9Abin01_0970 [Gammaproteobacteria bacterium]|nr:MAG: hypothetical protein BMS9Abin01_0970 [Gammaproteobacteria bacterium]